MNEIINREVAIMLITKDYLNDKETIQEMFDRWDKLNEECKLSVPEVDEMCTFQAKLYLIQTLLLAKKILKDKKREILNTLLAN